MSDMTVSNGSPSQSLHGGDIHLSPQHSLSDMNSINDHSLHERSYIQCMCFQEYFWMLKYYLFIYIFIYFFFLLQDIQKI